MEELPTSTPWLARSGHKLALGGGYCNACPKCNSSLGCCCYNNSRADIIFGHEAHFRLCRSYQSMYAKTSLQVYHMIGSPNWRLACEMSIASIWLQSHQPHPTFLTCNGIVQQRWDMQSSKKAGSLDFCDQSAMMVRWCSKHSKINFQILFCGCINSTIRNESKANELVIACYGRMVQITSLFAAQQLSTCRVAP